MMHIREAFICLLLIGLLHEAEAHGYVTKPVSTQALTYMLRAYGDWQQGMPGTFRYEPWSARIAPGASPSSPGDSCGIGAGPEYEQGLQKWQPWFNAAGVPVPTIRPGGEVDVSVTFTADHGGQAWFEIACSDTLNENTEWILLERASSDRTINFMSGLPTICAWGNIGDGCTSIRWVVPNSFQCPSGRAVGRWVWKVGNTCIDADNRGIDTEKFSYQEWQAVTGNRGEKCGTSPEHFVSCFVFRVGGSVSGPSQTPTVTPASAPSPSLAPASQPTRALSQTPIATPVPTPSPSLAPTSQPTRAPSLAPYTSTCVPIGHCGEFSWCTQDAYIRYCYDAGMSNACPDPFCKTSQMDAEPEPEQEGEPESEPEPEAEPLSPATQMQEQTPLPTASTPPLQDTCVPTNEGLYNNPAVYGPMCEVASLACPAPMCKRAGSLLDGRRSQRHSFLGTALIQKGIVVECKFEDNGQLEL